MAPFVSRSSCINFHFLPHRKYRKYGSGRNNIPVLSSKYIKTGLLCSGGSVRGWILGTSWRKGSFSYTLLSRQKWLLLICSMLVEFSRTPHQDRNIALAFLPKQRQGLKYFQARVCVWVIPWVVVSHRTATAQIKCPPRQVPLPPARTKAARFFFLLTFSYFKIILM